MPKALKNINFKIFEGYDNIKKYYFNKDGSKLMLFFSNV